jgi:uncharacterized LabA/DUF88 family protein
MDLKEFKSQHIKDELGITPDFGTIFTFLDYANVNNWFAEDKFNYNSNLLLPDEYIDIDLVKLNEFTDFFSTRTRIYYGENPSKVGSLSFTHNLRKIYGKRNVVTKDLQKIKHYIKQEDTAVNRQFVKFDKNGKLYVEIRKCNFDIEIAVDACKMVNHFDTFCIFSGDADFAYLNNYLKHKGKKIIIVKSGHILAEYRKTANLVVNAQDIKSYISRISKKTKT